jgi:hypothetical protein
MCDLLTFVDDPELHTTACYLRGCDSTPAQRDAYSRARAQATFLGYAMRELPRDGKPNEPKRLAWADIAPLCRVPKELIHA